MINAYASRFVLNVKPGEFSEKLEELRKRIREASQTEKYILLRELNEITIDLHSYLLRLNLQNPNDPNAISDDVLHEEIRKNRDIIQKLKKEDLLDINNAVEHTKSSNLYRLTRMDDAGEVSNRWGHNLASGLKDAMRRGASLVTTNPMLINLVRKDFPEYWNGKRDEFKAKNPGLKGDDLVAALTTQIVLESAKLLRPVYLVSNGQMGYVSFQLNPNKSSNKEAMIRDADMIWHWLKEGFNGEEPNVIFKVPGTYAGLDVAEYLTQRRIGVNITVNYTVPQQLAFGEIIERGKARFCYLTQMNNRLDDIVAEELGEGKADDPGKASTWASATVIRRAYKTLYEEKKCKRSILLAASINKPWHVQRNITKGYPIHMTISPQPIDAFDKDLKELRPVINEPIPDYQLESLRRSKVFEQAYEFDILNPQGFDEFTPTKTTLDGFKQNYDEFLVWCNEWSPKKD